MALRARSLFLYGLQVTTANRSIDFIAVTAGATLQATLTIGYYNLSGLMAEIKRAMQAADPSRVYTVTADRTYAGGTENRITISTSGTFLSLLFASGPRAGSSVAPLIGFPSADQVGNITYTGITSAGTPVVSTLNGYSYLSSDQIKKVFGSLNISTTGEKEAVVFQIQQFFQVQFKYEPSAKITTDWVPLFTWMIQQRPLEFTPEITSPNVFEQCTLEKTAYDGKGLGYQFKEMLPEFPFLYDTGLVTYRKKVT